MGQEIEQVGAALKGEDSVRTLRQKNILIAGCGSLGGRLAFELADHARVVCFDPAPGLIRRRGVTLLESNSQGRRRVPVAGRVSACRIEDLDVMIVATKCRDMKAAVRTTARYCRPKVVLFLQNGDFSLEWVSRYFPDATVLRGATTMAAQADRAGSIRLFMRGVFYLGVYKGQTEQLRQVVRLFRAGGIKTAAVKDYRSAVWAKLIFSAALNPLTVLTGTHYGIIRKDVHVYRAVSRAIDEGKQVARKLGVTLAFDPMVIVRDLRSGSLGRFLYKGSMYDDFVHARSSELDNICGALLRQARSLGIRTPVLAGVHALTRTAVLAGRDARLEKSNLEWLRKAGG